MRTIIQVSDLHFGAILQPTLEPLLQLMHDIKPDLVIVSGDLTQRAQEEQFIEAKRYIDRMPGPKLIIPGNHDIPLYNVFRRFVSPLDYYAKHITTDLAPVFIDEEIAIVGLNSARSLTFKGGTISGEQIADAKGRFQNPGGNPVRIVVTHHPFDIPVALSGVSIVNGARHAIEEFARFDVSLFLTGHLHLIHRAKASIYVPGYDALLLGAGTATSTRARGEPNSFFVFRIDHTRLDSECIEIETHSWNPARNAFEISDRQFAPRVSRLSLHHGHGSGITA
ncbi:MAG: metallophosphoesterase [Gemmatimonadaceae bacterium]